MVMGVRGAGYEPGHLEQHQGAHTTTHHHKTPTEEGKEGEKGGGDETKGRTGTEGKGE